MPPHGQPLFAVDGGEVSANPAWPILTGVGKMESQNSSARVRRRNEERRRAGRPTGGGRRPYGFGKDRVTPVKPAVDVLPDVAARVIGGESLCAVVHDLNRLGVPTPGGSWAVAGAHAARDPAQPPVCGGHDASR